MADDNRNLQGVSRCGCFYMFKSSGLAAVKSCICICEFMNYHCFRAVGECNDSHKAG